MVMSHDWSILFLLVVAGCFVNRQRSSIYWIAESSLKSSTQTRYGLLQFCARSHASSVNETTVRTKGLQLMLWNKTVFNVQRKLVGDFFGSRSTLNSLSIIRISSFWLSALCTERFFHQIRFGIYICVEMENIFGAKWEFSQREMIRVAGWGPELLQICIYTLRFDLRKFEKHINCSDFHLSVPRKNKIISWDFYLRWLGRILNAKRKKKKKIFNATMHDGINWALTSPLLFKSK